MEQNRNKQQELSLMRPCLGCRASFVADTPFIRICPACKAGEEWQSGDDFAVHTPDRGREAANDN